MSNCVSCGKYAAEGNWICPNCHVKANKSYADLEQDLKAAHEEIGSLKVKLENTENQLEHEKYGRIKYQCELEKIHYCVEGCKRCDYFIVKTENAELKTRLEMAETTLFAVIRNSTVMPSGMRLGKSMEEIDDMALATVGQCYKDIDFVAMSKNKASAEARLKELKGE